MKRSRKILIIAASAAAVVAIAAAVILITFNIESVTVSGSSRYTDEEIEEYVIGDGIESNTALLYVKTKLGILNDIPFIEKYTVKITSYDSVKITVYEKSLAGCLKYMGKYMYFDKDGLVVESSDEHVEGVPLISGLKYEYIILGEQIPVENEDVFDMLLEVSQILEKTGISADKIYVSDSLDVTLTIGDIKVSLGQGDLSEKLSDLADMYDNLSGYSGTLDMSELSDDGEYRLKTDD